MVRFQWSDIRQNPEEVGAMRQVLSNIREFWLFVLGSLLAFTLTSLALILLLPTCGYSMKWLDKYYWGIEK